MSGLLLILFVGFCIWLTVLPGEIAEKKGRSYWGFIFLGVFLTPVIAAIIASCVSPDYREMRRVSHK